MQSLGEFQNTLVNSSKDHDDDSSFWDDAADSIAGLGEWISGLWNDLTGLSAQQNEFAQQEYLQDKMNEYNLPVNQMARLRAAGINPNTAAAGIAKAGSESAQAPAVNTNTQGVQGAVNTLANGLNSLSNARKLFKEGNVVESLAENTIAVGRGQIERWSYENGLTDAETQGLLIDNETRSDMNRADLNIKIQQHENMKKEGDLIQGQKDYLERQIAWYDEQIAAEIDLTKKRALEAEKNAFYLEELKKTEQMENDFAEKFHYRRDQPFDMAMLSLWFNGDYEKAIKAEEFMFDLKYGASYNTSLGAFDAEVDTAFEKEFNRALGALPSEEIRHAYEIEEDSYREFFRYFYDTPDNLKELFLKKLDDPVMKALLLKSTRLDIKNRHPKRSYGYRHKYGNDIPE